MVRCLAARVQNYLRYLAVFAALLMLQASSHAVAETKTALRLTTLEWPPHIFADGSGPVADAVREIFSRKGLAVTIEVHPWHRAVALAAENKAYAGVFPEYYSPRADAEADGHRCLFSRPFGKSPIGLAELSSNPVIWDKIGDLADLRIGTVRGYKNEDMFDLLVATGRIHAVETTSDEQNLRNLLQGKIAAAVIDLQVFEHLIATTQDLKDAAGKLQFNSRLLAIPDFHVCFQNSPQGRRAREAFEEGL
ncbi:transporter substrate-binding domain-containing protein [Pannonibacter sp. Pt2]|uniref:Transporter substrate-binding domain-containing protein n=2 Tax=Pannonibacter anstelovis TaxID=3121537 RepID=A0ABU7ZSS2_9HYPH